MKSIALGFPAFPLCTIVLLVLGNVPAWVYIYLARLHAMSRPRNPWHVVFSMATDFILRSVQGDALEAARLLLGDQAAAAARQPARKGPVSGGLKGNHPSF